MQLETDEHWYSLFGFFYSQQNDEQKLEIIQPWNKDSLLVEIFDVLKTGRVDTLKVNMLIFIEENTSFFFGNHPTTLQGACTLMNELLMLPSNGSSNQPHTSLYVKCQVLTTLTSILIGSHIIEIQPSAIEAFVELLLDIISKTNTLVDRNLRQTACECLRELDLHYPGLLSQRLGDLMNLVQDEKTHAHQSYLSLLSSVLVHTLDRMQKTISFHLKNNSNINDIHDSDIEILEKELGDLLGSKMKSNQTGSLNFKLFRKSNHSNYQIPSNVLENPFPWRMVIDVPKRPHSFMTFLRSQIRNVLRTLLETLPLMVPMEALRISMDIVFLISNVTLYSLDGKMSEGEDIPLSVDSLTSVLKPFLRTHSLMLWNAVLVILNGLPYHQVSDFHNGLREILDENVLNVLNSHYDDTIDESRFIVLEWIANNLVRYKSDQIVSLASILHPSRKKFYPTQFDNINTVKVKLHTLTYFYEKKPGSKLLPPDNLVNILTCLNDFTFYKPNHFKVKLVFTVLKQYLKVFPTQFDFLFEFVSASMQRQPAVTQNVLHMLKRTGNLKEDLDPKTHTTFLTRLSEFLSQLDAPRIFDYMELLSTIIQYTFLNVNKIIKAIYLNLTACKTVLSGDWLFGDSLLSIIHTIMCTYPTSMIQISLSEVLSFLIDSFADVEIRDRSKMYLRLLTHVPDDRLKTIFSEEPLDYSNEPLSAERESQETTSESTLIPAELERLHPTYNYHSLLIHDTQDDAPDVLDNDDKPLKSYLQFLELSESYQNSEMLLFNIRLPYLLKFKTHNVSSKGTFKNIYSIRLEVGGSQMNLKNTFVLEVPILSEDIEANDMVYGEKIFDQTLGRFPSSYSFILDLVIPIPIPTTFDIKMTFNSEDGITETMQLQSLQLGLRDLMLPVPHYVHHYKNGYNRTQYLATLFDEFWHLENFENHESIAMEQSVKAFEVAKDVSLKAIQDNLLPFIVDPGVLKEQTQDVCVFIFLPRKYHLLMKITLNESHTVIQIKTDFWRILSFLDKFLDDLFR